MSPVRPFRALSGASESFRYYALLHLVVLIWGCTGVLGRLITLDSVSLVFYRVTIALPAIAGFLLWSGVRVRTDRAGLARFTGIGFIVAIHWFLFFQAVKMSNVSVALVCQSTAPFFTALLEPIVFRRRLQLHEVILGIVTAAGVAVIFGFEMQHAAGIAVGLGAAFVGAVYTVLNGRLVVRYDSRVMALIEFVAAWTLLFLVLLLIKRPVGSIPVPAGADLGYLVLLGTICTAFAFIGGTYVMRKISPFTVMLATNLEPVYGILLALVVFGESEWMSPGFYAGTAVILLSISVNAIIVRRRFPAIAEDPNGDRPATHPDAA